MKIINNETVNLIDAVNNIREDFFKKNNRFLTDKEVLDLVEEARKSIDDTGECEYD